MIPNSTGSLKWVGNLAKSIDSLCWDILRILVDGNMNLLNLTILECSSIDGDDDDERG